MRCVVETFHLLVGEAAVKDGEAGHPTLEGGARSSYQLQIGVARHSEQ
jgi:hypothetical protein